MNDLVLELQILLGRMWSSFAKTCSVSREAEILEFSEAMGQAQEITEKLLNYQSRRTVIFDELPMVHSIERPARKAA